MVTLSCRCLLDLAGSCCLATQTTFRCFHNVATLAKRFLSSSIAYTLSPLHRTLLISQSIRSTLLDTTKCEYLLWGDTEHDVLSNVGWCEDDDRSSTRHIVRYDKGTRVVYSIFIIRGYRTDILVNRFFLDMVNTGKFWPILSWPDHMWSYETRWLPYPNGWCAVDKCRSDIGVSPSLEATFRTWDLLPLSKGKT